MFKLESSMFSASRLNLASLVICWENAGWTEKMMKSKKANHVYFSKNDGLFCLLRADINYKRVRRDGKYSCYEVDFDADTTSGAWQRNYKSALFKMQLRVKKRESG